MNEVFKLVKGDWILTHSWYTNDLGLKTNAFDINNTTTRKHCPFFGDMRVSNYSRNTPFGGDDVSPYSEKEYESMLDREVAKISTESLSTPS